MMPDLLFIYGTLHPDRAPASIAPTARLLKPFGGSNNRATIQAHLYDLGPYPGVVLTDDPTATVSGELFLLPDDPTVLTRLDAYEDYNPTHPTTSLFLRHRTMATLEDATKLETWVYIYNRPVT